MIKAIFFDVDGTLVSFRTHMVSPTVLKALHALRAKGIKLFLATGRQKTMIRHLQELFPFDGYVTLSGQYCFVGEQVLRSCPMSPQAVEAMVEAVRANTFSTIFLEGEEIYLNCVNDMTSQFMEELSLPMPPIRPAEYALGREIYQAVTFLDQEHEHLLLDQAPQLKTTRWHPNFLDVIPDTGGKDLGLDAILDHFGIPLAQSMAFGDGENDLSMLMHAGIGVAMGTASHGVKAQADYTTASVDEDGVVLALRHFGLLD